MEYYNTNTVTDRSQLRVRAFNNHYHKVLTYLKNSNIAYNAEFELTSFMMFIADFYSHMVFSDRDELQADLLPYAEMRIEKLHQNNPKITIDLFYQRQELYATIIKNHYIRSDWSFGKTKGGTAISNAMVAFGDILINPACANNYESAPVMLHGLAELSDFSDLFLKVVEELSKFLSDIYPDKNLPLSEEIQDIMNTYLSEETPKKKEQAKRLCPRCGSEVNGAFCSKCGKKYTRKQINLTAYLFSALYVIFAVIYPFIALTFGYGELNGWDVYKGPETSVVELSVLMAIIVTIIHVVLYFLSYRKDGKIPRETTLLILSGEIVLLLVLFIVALVLLLSL